MPDPLSVGDVAALLFDERKYDEPLTRKEFHKLMYFARKELDDLDVPADIPYFWYKFGTMTPTTDASIVVERTNQTSAVSCTRAPDELDLSSDLAAQARLAIRRVLNHQYEIGTEPLTDLMYDEAPYEVQRHYRRLDKQLGVLTGKRDDDIDTSKAAIRETLFDLVNAFPLDTFPEFRGDLYVWYDVLSAELDAYQFSPNQAHEIAEAFWTGFAVELAQRENTGVTKSEIVATLGTDEETFHNYAEEQRMRLHAWDRERTQLLAEPENERLIDVAEAVVVANQEIPTP